MRRLLSLIVLCLLSALVSFTQNRVVTGKITDDKGSPVENATVKVKGSKKGVSADAEGNYSISVAPGATLIISGINITSKEIPVGSQSVVNATVTRNTAELANVVVTALGVRRDKRTLGYSQTSVKNETINKSSSIDLFSGLQGKMAGVTISEVSGTPGGSTKVILRGFSSIGQSNQPLYVIDGVPLDNSRPGSSNAYDFGNNANDIDPNSIENMSILKGSSATALYGSRGSSGVILITTKKGRSGKPQVEFSSGTTTTNVAITYKPQSQFGQGWNGHFILSENGDWGPKFDGVLRPWGAIVDNSQLLKPYSFIKNNVADLFDPGFELNNNISVSGGNDVSTYRFSYGNIYSNGVLPGDHDVFKRNNFSVNAATKYQNLKIEGSLNYTTRNGNVPQTGDGDNRGSGFYSNVLNIPNDIPIKDLRNYKNKYFNVDNYYTPYAENPYYSLNENGSIYTTNHLYGSINLNYKFTNWFTLNIQQGADVSNTYAKIWNNINNPSPGSWNAGANVEGSVRAPVIGSVTDQSFNTFEYDTKVQGLVSKKLSNDFDLNALLGSSYNDRGSRSLSTEITGLAIPGFYQISNSLNPPASSQSYSHRRLVASYAQATIGFRNYAFLTATGRNDVTSTLYTGHNSYFYPGLSLSYVASDALHLKSNTMSYVKIRASYGQTGSDTNPYNILNTITPTSVPLSYGSINFPLNGVAGYTVSNSLLSTNLKPERITELELGGEFRFLKDRIALDISYYDRIRKDQILAVPIAPSSGYSSEVVNFGKVQNKGIELTLNFTPVKSRNVQWDVTYTYSRDRSKVMELPSGLDNVIINSIYDAELVATKGQPLGVFLAPVPAYDPEGHIIVNSTTGRPESSPTLGNYGSMESDFHMGLTNNLKVKNFSLGWTFDYNQGGNFYSGTADLYNFTGADPKTTYNDRNPFVVPNSVVAVTDNNGKTQYVENTLQQSQYNFNNYFYFTTNRALHYKNLILSKTFIKLREVTLAYSLPKTIAGKIKAQKATISVFGRNLYTWLPSSNTIIDPEVSNFGTDLASELGEFRTAPPLRYFGASLKITF